MKKIISLALSAVLFAMTLTGCSSSSDDIAVEEDTAVDTTVDTTEDENEEETITDEIIPDAFINPEISSTMKTIGGVEFSYATDTYGMILEDGTSTFSDEPSGVGFNYSEEFIEFNENYFVMPLAVSPTGISLAFYMSSTDDDSDSFSIDDVTFAYGLYKVAIEDGTDEFDLFTNEDYEIEHVAQYDGYNFYYAYLKSTDGIEGSEEEIAGIEEFLTFADDLKSNIFIFPIVSEDDDASDSDELSSIGTFETVDIDGNTITEDIFSDYDLTAINIWATWCTSCTDEMGSLQEVYESLDSNINFITICGDSDTELELAQTILDTNGCEFTTLVINEEIYTNIFYYLSAYPTTIFVDSEGNIVGEFMVGAPTSDVVNTYLTQINDRYELLS